MKWPNIDDLSPDNPAMGISSAKIRGLYKQDKKIAITNITPKIKTWFEAAVKHLFPSAELEFRWAIGPTRSITGCTITKTGGW